ncbi:MAG: hypothetical protein WBD76_09535 [Methyloceanibacter sp.]
MIDVGIYLALGFLVASLLALMLTRPFWRRAVRLTTRELEATMPMSIADIQADKDQLRAEFAIELRRVEVALERAKDKAARELVEANKRRVEIAEINTTLEAVKGRLQEKENANRVLEQTIRRRLPELESRLRAAKDAMAELESANAELRNTLGSQGEALKLARSTVNTQRGDIDQLRGALGDDASSRRSAKSESALAKENRKLSAQLSALKEELTRGRIGGKENELLRQELGRVASQVLTVAKAHGTALPDFVAAEIVSAPVEEAASEPATIGNGSNERTGAVPVADEPHGEAAQKSLATRSDQAEGQTPETVEEDPKAQGKLARILSARKARRRGSRGGGRTGSLSERLKDVSAEASDS